MTNAEFLFWLSVYFAIHLLIYFGFRRWVDRDLARTWLAAGGGIAGAFLLMYVWDVLIHTIIHEGWDRFAVAFWTIPISFIAGAFLGSFAVWHATTPRKSID